MPGQRWVALLAVVIIGNTSSAAANTIAGGNRHTVVVTPDGLVWTWGGNGNGQLGDGTTTGRTTPGLVGGIDEAVAVAAGALHTLVLRSDGTVWAWGANGDGQLGDGTTIARHTPVAVANLTGVVAIGAGASHSVALTSDGRVWTWGRNANGQLGDGSTSGATQAGMVSSLTSIAAIAAGGNHTLAVKSDGTAWAWGLNASGQLGDGSTTQRTSPVQMSSVTDAALVAGGTAHSLILNTDGTVRATGSNSNGQLGDNTQTQRTSPVAVSGLTGVISIAAGQASSYARKSDGSVWAWGSNIAGRLGDGTTTMRKVPTQASLSGIALLGAGNEHALAVSSTGVVWTWGDNSWGQLGDGTTINRLTPMAISDVDYAWKVATSVFSVAAGTYTTPKEVVVTNATPGAAIHYTLTGDTPTESDPTIASGSSIVIDETRTLKARAWKTGMTPGDTTNATYTLAVATVSVTPGTGTYTSPQTVSMSTTSPDVEIRYTADGSTPTESSALYTSPLTIGTSTTIKAIGFRTNWTPSAMTTRTYTMNFGTLAAPAVDPPAGTYSSGAIVSISAMPGATIRYTTNGTNVTTSSPIYSEPLSLAATTTINARAYHPDYTTSSQTTAAYTIVVATPELSHTSGTYAAGQVLTITTATPGATLHYTLNGQTPTTSDPVVPAGGIVVGNYTLKVGAWKTGCTPSPIVTASYSISGSVATAQIAGGMSHSLAVRADGVLWAWGYNGNGRLGDGTTTNRLLPVIVSGVTGATAIAGGDAYSLAVRSDGSAWAWGYNSNGQLGDGTTTARLLPAPVSGLTGVVSVSAGSAHSLALRSDGILWSWGRNTSGQVGDGTTTDRLTPVQVPGLSAVTRVSASSQHSFAVTSDGVAWSWGNNGNGQLGTGNTTSRSTPGQVSGITTATSVAAGGFHGLALLADGSVQSWGNNSSGQLGDGTGFQRTTPVTVSALANVAAIAAGSSHSLALAQDGSVWAWGLNSSGQLGDGTTTNRNTPAQVQGLWAIVSIAAGASHSLAIAEDGSVWAWGRNANGEVGDGTTTNRLTPVLIADSGMVWKVPTPLFSVPGGLYFVEQTVTVTSGDPDATLHYTTNGTSPTEADPVVASGGTLPVTSSLTLKVRAWKPGAVASEVAVAAYELKVVAPSFSPGTAQYATPQNVTVSSSTTSTTFTYTIDGTEPDASSTAYTGPIAVAGTRTLKARAFRTGWTPSDSDAASYWISNGTVATPTITPEGGAYTGLLLVSLECGTAGATIRYTLDGTDPDARSQTFEFPFLVDRTSVVKARAFAPNFSPSAVATATYSLDDVGQAGIPGIVPGGGWFATRQIATITGPAGAVLRYTTNGVDPTETDPVIASGGTVVIDSAQILKVRAWEAGLSPSAIRRADFVITGAIAAGHQHSLGLAGDQTVWAWGRGTEGQIGDGTWQDKPSPVSVLTSATAVAGGQHHSLAALADGSVRAWGHNGSGRLGDGTTTNRNVPVEVAGLAGIVAVAAGYDHSLALASDGRVWAWGNNAHGQLGDGTTTTRPTAVQVIGLSGVTRIAAGEGFSIALQADGAGGGFVWTWGKNGSGQLGDGSLFARTVPVRVPGIDTAVQVAAGQAFAIAVLSDRTVRVWGANDSGQLGDLAGGLSTSPLPLSPLRHISRVAAGARHGLAVDGDGYVWGWGLYADGQLGTQPYVNTTVMGAPQMVRGARGIFAAAAGWQHSLLLRGDGTVLAAGSLAATGLGPGHHYAVAEIPGLSLASNLWLMTDGDDDGLPAWREYLASLDPLNPDTNGNGVRDSADLLQLTHSGNPDDDGDGVPNIVEIAQGTDPFNVDTDGDGVPDLLDAYPLDPTRWQKPAPDPNDTTPPTIILIYPASARPVGGGN